MESSSVSEAERGELCVSCGNICFSELLVEFSAAYCKEG